MRFVETKPGEALCDQWVERGGGVRTACGKPAVLKDLDAQVGRDPAHYCADHWTRPVASDVEIRA